MVGRGPWELDLAPGWRAKDDDECLTLTKSREGAFQLSSSTKTIGAIDLDEIREFYGAKLPPDASFAFVDFGTFAGYAAEFIDANRLWRKYWLAHTNVLVFATYIGASGAWSQDRAEVHRMLSSLCIVKAA